MSIDSLMNATADVISFVSVSDAYGTFANTSDTRYDDMPCRIQPISGQERVRYGGERVTVTHKLFCPPEYSGLDETDIVRSGGIRYEVKVVRNIDGMGHHLEAELQELRADIA